MEPAAHSIFPCRREEEPRGLDVRVPIRGFPTLDQDPDEVNDRVRPLTCPSADIRVERAAFDDRAPIRGEPPSVAALASEQANLVPEGNEPADQMTSHEAGAPGNENGRHLAYLL